MALVDQGPASWGGMEGPAFLGLRDLLEMAARQQTVPLAYLPIMPPRAETVVLAEFVLSSLGANNPRAALPLKTATS